MPRLRFLRPLTGLGLEKRGIHPQIWPFIGRFYYLRLFAWLLLVLIGASLKPSKQPNKDTSNTDNGMKIGGFLLVSGGKTAVVFEFEE